MAIARGSAERQKRYGQIEICDVETGNVRHIIKGFDGAVWSVLFSADGKTIISSSSEFLAEKIQAGPRKGNLFAELKWWDAATGELKHKKTMPNKDRLAVLLSYSPAGNLLASVEYYREVSVTGGYSYVEDVKLLDAQTGEIKRKLKSGLRSDWGGVFTTDEGRIRFVRLPWQNASQLYQNSVFSPDGQLLAVQTPADKIKIWNTQTGKEVHSLKDFPGPINAMSFSPDNRTLAIASTPAEQYWIEDRISLTKKSEIRLYDLNTGKVRDTLTGHDGISSMTFMPNSNILLIGSYKYENRDQVSALKLLDIQTGKLTVFPTDSQRPIRSLVLTPDGRSLGIRNTSPIVTIVDTQTWSVKNSFDKDEDDEKGQKQNSHYMLSVSHFLAAAFSPDGKTLAGGNEKNEIKLWDPRTGEVKRVLKGHEGAVSSLAISPDGNTLVSGSLDETARVWDLQTGSQKAVLEKHAGGGLSSVALSPDGRMLAIGAGDTLELWDAATNKLKQTLAGHKAAVNSVCFSADGQMLASASDDGTIKIWDARTGEIQRTLAGAGKPRTVSFAPDGQTLAGAGDNGTVSLWTLQTGALKQTLKKHDAPVNAIAFSRDGQFLASGSDDRTVIVWETSTGKSKHTLKGHDLTVTSVAFSPDGTLIASASGNDSVVLWDVKTGKLSRVLK